MKAKTIYLFLSLSIPYISVSQNPADCGCSAALRYDVYRDHKDFYSEMLLAREINSENYQELRQTAGGSLSLFGIEVGANGENVTRINDIAYNQSTDNNDNKHCGMFCPIYLGQDRELLATLPVQPDGPGRKDNLAEDGGTYFATRLWFKVHAPQR